MTWRWRIAGARGAPCPRGDGGVRHGAPDSDAARRAAALTAAAAAALAAAAAPCPPPEASPPSRPASRASSEEELITGASFVGGPTALPCDLALLLVVHRREAPLAATTVTTTAPATAASGHVVHSFVLNGQCPPIPPPSPASRPPTATARPEASGLGVGWAPAGEACGGEARRAARCGKSIRRGLPARLRGVTARNSRPVRIAGR